MIIPININQIFCTDSKKKNIPTGPGKEKSSNKFNWQFSYAFAIDTFNEKCMCKRTLIIFDSIYYAFI